MCIHIYITNKCTKKKKKQKQCISYYRRLWNAITKRCDKPKNVPISDGVWNVEQTRSPVLPLTRNGPIKTDNPLDGDEVSVRRIRPAEPEHAAGENIVSTTAPRYLSYLPIIIYMYIGVYTPCNNGAATITRVRLPPKIWKTEGSIRAAAYPENNFVTWVWAGFQWSFNVPFTDLRTSLS